MKIMQLDEIKEVIKSSDIISAIEKGFVAYSKGETVIPPVGELLFNHPPGDVHIKYGYIQKDDFYLIKIASGFYDNPKINLPSSNGLMLLFNQKTGQLVRILLDEGYLTDERTAAAGAVCAKYLAPSQIQRIGIIGTGTQAKRQLLYLKPVISCRDVLVLGRNHSSICAFQNEMRLAGFNIEIAATSEDIANRCNLIITTTPAKSPILFAKQIKAGTHITAVGADTECKQELDENVFGIADVIVADSVAQCMTRGDISHAIKKKIITEQDIVELGHIISGNKLGRVNDNQITIADLTGLAVQDIQIAKLCI